MKHCFTNLNKLARYKESYINGKVYIPNDSEDNVIDNSCPTKYQNLNNKLDIFYDCSDYIIAKKGIKDMTRGRRSDYFKSGHYDFILVFLNF